MDVRNSVAVFDTNRKNSANEVSFLPLTEVPKTDEISCCIAICNMLVEKLSF